MVRLLSVWLATAALLLAGCGSSTPDEPPPDPLELLTEAANNIRAADTFRLEVRHFGADYLIAVYLDNEARLANEDADPIRVAFRRAVAQYVAPEQLQASVSIILGGATVGLDIYAQGDNQWFKLPMLNWVNAPFAPGFNPRTLIAEDSGFQAALAALTDLDYIGEETLEDGTGVFHLAGIANGPDVTDLLVGMIEAEGLVPVDVYIDREHRYPVRLVITQPETDPDDPTRWVIDVYDVNAAPQLTPPADA